MNVSQEQDHKIVEESGTELSSPISAAPAETEHHQQLVEWNSTQQNYPHDQCIHQLFEAQVARTPDAIAIVFAEQQLTYEALNQRANQLAVRLQSRGVGPDVLVGLCVERSLDMVVGLFGILKAGGAYVPLDPSYPEARLELVLRDAQVKVLLTQTHLLDLLPEQETEVICFEGDAIASPPKASQTSLINAPKSGVTAQHLAYVIYTSGSTGVPKGVQIEHRSVVNFLTSMQTDLRLTAADRMAAVTTLAFDISALEIYLPLIVGAQVLIVPRAIAGDGTGLQAQLQAAEVTVMQATPATWHLLLASGWSSTATPMTLLCGGEALSPDLATQLSRPGQKLWNLYGPTEATIWSTRYCVEYHGAIAGKVAQSIPIGRPLANTQLYILDQHLLQPVAIGEVGELHIGGLGLARGYLYQPELTTAKFIPNPFGAGRLYKTGDLARYRPNGDVEFLGRLDHQVKVRGFRIELGEIETALSQHPQVHQCAVLALGDSAEHKRLIAYVRGDRSLDGNALRRSLEQQLPAYMVPNRVVPILSFPLTPNGKIDRAALPHSAETLHRITPMAPRTETEARLVMAWSRVLRQDDKVIDIGIHDNFFELGGNSIIGAQLCAEIAKNWGKALPLATLLQAPTIAQLAHYLDHNLETSESSLVTLQPNGSQPPLFCIHGVGGNVMSFYELAHSLGQEQPVYALQSQGLEGKTKPLTTIEAMARCYLAQIQAVFPHGPYLLAGYCMGSFIALEMAHLARLQGEEIGFLALLDPDEAQLNVVRSRPHRGLRERLQSLQTRLKAEGVLPIFKQKLAQRSFKAYQRYGVPLLPLLSLSAEFRLLKVLDANMKASEQYRTTISSPCKTLLVLSEEAMAQEAQHQRFWTQIAADLEIHPVPGRHRTGVPEGFLREPQVKTLATVLKASIDQVRIT
ncbi:MAG: amino acid adenylation domain-containing protein [Thermosynechococcaceae cyanobacterium]